MPHSPPKPASSKAPKYIQLADRLREQVRSGALKPGDQLPTFAQMQAEFGLGQATLERTYAILEEEQLIIRQPGRGTFVAPAKASPQHITVGLLVQSFRLEHPYQMHLLRGMREAAGEAGVEIMLLHENSTIGWEKIDGVLFVDQTENTRPIPPSMPRAGIFSFIDSIHYATVDDYTGARDLVRHLVSLGHRRISFLLMNYRQHHPVTGERLRGYMEGMQEAGLPLPASCKRNLREAAEPMQRYNDFGYEKMSRWLDEGWEKLGCTAVVGHNDEAALGMMKALQERGLRVPEDVSITGFDGTEIADYYSPRLTTVSVPLEDIGAAAIRLLIDQIRGLSRSGEKRVISLPSVLRIAQSTASPREN